MTKDNNGAPRILAIDTSTAALTVAVVAGGELLGQHQSKAERNHSMNLIPGIQSLLQSLGMRPADLDAVAAGQGPGSYTGVRIAVSVAKTLAWSLQKPLIGISSLEALAAGGLTQARAELQRSSAGEEGVTWVVPLMDARRGQVFTSLFAATSFGGWSRLADDGIRLMSDWTGMLAERAQQHAGHSSELAGEPQRIYFVGEAEPHMAAIERLGELWSGEVRSCSCDMQACDVGYLAARKLLDGQLEDIHRFVPNYTQLAEAEAKLLAAQADKAGKAAETANER